MLRLAFCRSEDLRRWYLAQECELFRLRFRDELPSDQVTVARVATSCKLICAMGSGLRAAALAALCGKMKTQGAHELQQKCRACSTAAAACMQAIKPSASVRQVAERSRHHYLPMHLFPVSRPNLYLHHHLHQQAAKQSNCMACKLAVRLHAPGGLHQAAEAGLSDA